MPATEHFFRNQNKLHLIFAVSCVALFVSVILMMVDDYADPWRGYQAKNFELQTAAREQEIKDLQNEKYQEEKAALEKQQADVDSRLGPLSELRDQIAEERATSGRLVEQLTLRLKNEGAERDEARADFDLAIRDDLPHEYKARLEGLFHTAQAVCDATQLELEAAQDALKKIGSPESDPAKAADLEKIRELEAQTAEIKKSMDKLDNDLTLAENALTVIHPTDPLMKFKRRLMALPIIEGFNGQFKVTQDWLPDLHQTLGMTSIARFDRCRTCHLNVDRTTGDNQPAFPHGHSDSGDVKEWIEHKSFPHPFATHPRHDLFVTASSPHPLTTFGCTSCHDGQGSGVDFGNAEHSPNDPHQSEHWHHEYGYHPNHFWEYPMQPKRFNESTCLKCHHGVTELGVHPKFGASAPKVYAGYNLIQKYGCFGCHEMHGFDGGKPIGPDLRLEPQTPEEAQRIADDPTQIPGKMRKVGPSLKHVAAKTSKEFIAYWTELPGRFRPTTKMPQFFQLSEDLSEGGDDLARTYEAVELAAIAHTLTKNSQPIDLLHPADGYTPNAERGKQLFSERGCLACHEHSAVPGTKADFGPNISDIHRKVNRNEGNAAFSDWLYTWIREPERHHRKTRMPNLYLNAYQSGEETIDPAADIVAFLLSRGEAEDFASKVADPLMLPSVLEEDGSKISPLDSLVKLFLRKSRFSEEAAAEILASRRFPQQADKVRGDEKVLATKDGAAVADDAEWAGRKLDYIGLRTINRYGCYACHEIPGFEEARPIGVALQNWGRKDTSQLGFEHIQEYLHHHGEPDGSSTVERIEDALATAESGALEGTQQLEEGLSAAYFYDSIQHHGRPGFVWQKLRNPRSYDFMKIDTKGYDDRLKMPKFPLTEGEIESIATFILGMVAEPPAPKYIYQPDVQEKNRIEGEFLLAKFNCTGCHMVDLPKVTYGVNVEEDVIPTQLAATDHPDAVDLLLQFRKPRLALTGETRQFMIEGEAVQLPLASFHGLRVAEPDPEEEDPEFRESGFDTWETIDFSDDPEDPLRLLPSSRISIPDSKLVSYEPGRGGDFAEWLVKQLMETTTGGNRSLAWQASPPPLYQEGFKVQTPWLYQFLLEPEQIRYTTVLRMPRFNMTPAEAQTLANYFAAVDGSEFPYQEKGPSNNDYLADRQHLLAASGHLGADQSYLTEGWKALNGPLCIGCHSVGTRKYVKKDEKSVQGPNLNRVERRLRADWVKLWLYKPTWITPYTSMPVNFAKNATQWPDLLKGDPDAHVIGVRDALANYSKLLEEVGPVVYTPPEAADAPAGAAAGAEE
ncbi:MAG: c-type cytochrome [Planctomycetaceae bacterium]|nr:c-type cytochrome [Planctomycetaceae bacterium]